MKLYHYRRETGEYTGESEARLDTLETKKQKREIYLIPADATPIPPPETGDESVALHKNGVWSVKPDHRGKFVWLKTNPEARVKVQFIGDIDDAYTDQSPDGIDLPVWDGQKWIPNADAIAAKQAASKLKSDAKTKIDQLKTDAKKTKNHEELKTLVAELINCIKILV